MVGCETNDRDYYNITSTGQEGGPGLPLVNV